MPGGSFVRFEPPDLCIGTFVGDITPEDMAAMFDDLRRFSRGRPHVLTLADLTRCGTLSAAARKAAADAGKGLPVRGAAVVGASFQMRMFATLMTRALNLFNGASDTYNPLRFFDTEAEARAWLAERRRSVSQERG